MNNTENLYYKFSRIIYSTINKFRDSDCEDDYYIDRFVRNEFNELFENTSPNLYRIKNPNTNQSVIVCAETKEDAKLIHPNGVYIWNKEIEKYPQYWLEDWCLPKDVIVSEYIPELGNIVK